MSRRTATVEMAVSQINENGGLLGQTVEIVVADDYCDSEQAVAAANKLIAYGVDVVIGHNCSGAAIPASKVYADAGVLMITGVATNPMISDLRADRAGSGPTTRRRWPGSMRWTATCCSTAATSPKPPC